MSNELLFEIGTEEIPAGFLSKAIGDMEDIIHTSLTEKRIPFAGIKCMATPRRLVLYIAEIAREQEDQTIEKMGPTKKAAFDENGNPTKAALGFARGQGMEIADLEIIVTEKGEYLGARKTIAGQPTAALLPEILTNFLWQYLLKNPCAGQIMICVLPVQFTGLLALYDGNVVPLKIEDIVSGNTSCGHRFMSPEPFAVSGFDDYLNKSRENYVIADPAERRNLFSKELKALHRGRR